MKNFLIEKAKLKDKVTREPTGEVDEYGNQLLGPEKATMLYLDEVLSAI